MTDAVRRVVAEVVRMAVVVHLSRTRIRFGDADDGCFAGPVAQERAKIHRRPEHQWVRRRGFRSDHCAGTSEDPPPQAAIDKRITNVSVKA